jgi:hypothetical protein
LIVNGNAKAVCGVEDFLPFQPQLFREGEDANCLTRDSLHHSTPAAFAPVAVSPSIVRWFRRSFNKFTANDVNENYELASFRERNRHNRRWQVNPYDGTLDTSHFRMPDFVT